MRGPGPLLNLGIQPATDAHTGLQGAHGTGEWDSPMRQANVLRMQAEFCQPRPDAQSLGAGAHLLCTTSRSKGPAQAGPNPAPNAQGSGPAPACVPAMSACLLAHGRRASTEGTGASPFPPALNLPGPGGGQGLLTSL